jgi:hypothetical protein
MLASYGSSSIATAPLVETMLHDLESYPRVERRDILKGLTRPLFQIMVANGTDPRSAAEHLVMLGAAWSRSDWQMLCFWLFRQRDTEAFVEAAGLFELDVGCVGKNLLACTCLVPSCPPVLTVRSRPHYVLPCMQ